MSDKEPGAGGQEMPAVRTTIVGGRPPGCGKGIGEIPRGIEVLVKKASVDAEFRALLLERRAEAASEIGLELDPAEAAILNGLPREQLEAIIARTRVRPEHRAAFAGRNVLLMLAALGVATSSCDRAGPVRGIEPDGPEGDLPAVEQPAEPAQRPVSMGIRPPPVFPSDEAERPAAEENEEDEPVAPPPIVRGTRPDRPTTKGIRPDRP